MCGVIHRERWWQDLDRLHVLVGKGEIPLLRHDGVRAGLGLVIGEKHKVDR